MLHPGRFGFLITGAGRGGTSLLTALLDFHPEIEVGFERHMAHLMGRVPSSAETPATRLSAFRSECEQVAAASGKIWGNKITTEQIASLGSTENNYESSIGLFYDYFSDIRHIFILRDGRTCVRSKMTRTGIDMGTACARWLYSAKIFHYFESGRVNGIAVKFEHLLNDPPGTLKRICEFLGVAYHEIMLRGTNHPGLLPEYRREGFDLDPTQVTPMDDQFLDLIRGELRACGYVP